MTITVPSKAQSSGLAFLALLAGGVAVGFSPIFVRLSDLAPIASGFYRLALALPVLWLMQRAAPEAGTNGPPGRRDRSLLILTGAIFALDIVFWHVSLTLTSVADATLISNTAPILVAIGAIFLFGERMKPLFAGGMALAIAGVVILALQKSGGAEPPNRLLGDLLAIGAAVSYAAYLLLLAQLRRTQSTSRIVMYTTVTSALLLLPVALATSPTMFPASLSGWAVLFALAFISHIGGQSTMTYALAHLPAAFSSMTQFMQAVVAAIAAWAILGEPLTTMKVICAVFIFIGIALCSRARPAA
jgi:drug/metabolite transporter (DMT)-like permease